MKRRELVLLHGWAMRPRVWSPLLAALAPDFRVHNLALPGYADAGEPADAAAPGQAILDRWSDACLARVPAGALWVGWSLGALVAMNAMLRAPAQIAAAVLVAPTPRFSRAADWAYGVANELMQAFFTGVRMKDERILRRFARLQADDRRVCRTLADATVAGDTPWPALAAGLRVLDEVDLRARLAGLDTPLRVVQGEADRVVDPRAAAWVADTVGRGELLTLAAGHAPFVEHPRAVAAAIRSGS